MIPNQHKQSDLDAETIYSSQIFVVEGDKLCIESKEVGTQVFYTCT